MLDSAFGIQVLDEDLLPIDEEAMEYYEANVHADWAAFNPKESLECGKDCRHKM
jgi:hypothetical protein